MIVQKHKVDGISLIMMLVLSLITILLSIDLIRNYSIQNEFILAIFIVMPMLLCIGSTLILYRMYKKIVDVFEYFCIN